MGEKPNEMDEAGAAREAGTGMASGIATVSNAEGARGISSPRDAASGMASGRLAHESAHVPQQEAGRKMDDTRQDDQAGIAIGDPGVNGNIAGDVNPDGIAIGEEGVQRTAGDSDADGIAIDEEGVQRSGAMSSIQNMKARAVGQSGESPQPDEATSFNSSKSNVYRQAPPANDGSGIAVNEEGVPEDNSPPKQG